MAASRAGRLAQSIPSRFSKGAGVRGRIGAGGAHGAPRHRSRAQGRDVATIRKPEDREALPGGRSGDPPVRRRAAAGRRRRRVDASGRPCDELPVENTRRRLDAIVAVAARRAAPDLLGPRRDRRALCADAERSRTGAAPTRPRRPSARRGAKGHESGRRASDDPGDVDLVQSLAVASGDGLADPRPERVAAGRGPASKGRLARFGVGRPASRDAPSSSPSWPQSRTKPGTSRATREALEAIQGMTRSQPTIRREPRGARPVRLDARGSRPDLESRRERRADRNRRHGDDGLREFIGLGESLAPHTARRRADCARPGGAKREGTPRATEPGRRVWRIPSRPSAPGASGDISAAPRARSPSPSRAALPPSNGGLVLPLTFRSAPPPTPTPSPQ